MPFQILIPAYLPGEFDRAGVEVKVDQSRPRRRADGTTHLSNRGGRHAVCARVGAGQPRHGDPGSLAAHPDQVGPGLAALAGPEPGCGMGGRRPAARGDL